MDSIAARGFAQVLQQSTMGERYLADSMREMRMQSMKQAQERRNQDYKFMQEQMKLDKPDLSMEINAPLTDELTETKEAMDVLNRQVLSGDYTPDTMMAMSRLKTNYDKKLQLANGFQKDYEQALQMRKADKEGLINDEEFAHRVGEQMRNMWIRDADGSRQFNPETRSPMEIMNDPDLVNVPVLAKKFTDSLGEVVNESMTDAGWQTMSTKFTMSPLYQTDSKGNPVLDPDTGKYIPKASPESIALFDKMPYGKATLDRLASENNMSRSEAFKKFIVEPFASVKKEVDSKNKPSFLFNQDGKESDDAPDNAFEILTQATGGDMAALSQLNGGAYRFVYEDDFNGPQKEGRGSPRFIIVKKREQTTGDLGKEPAWVDIERIPLGGDQNPIAINRLARYLDEAHKTKVSKKIFEKTKEMQQQDSFEFDQIGQ